VAALYDKDWFIGKVTDIDDTDNEVEVSFMQKKKNLYQWPRNPDVIWIEKDDVLCTVNAPTETGKSKRMFRITDADEAIIIEKFLAGQ